MRATNMAIVSAAEQLVAEKRLATLYVGWHADIDMCFWSVVTPPKLLGEIAGIW
jgi:hypothetical protein